MRGGTRPAPSGCGDHSPPGGAAARPTAAGATACAMSETSVASIRGGSRPSIEVISTPLYDGQVSDVRALDPTCLAGGLGDRIWLDAGVESASSRSPRKEFSG